MSNWICCSIVVDVYRLVTSTMLKYRHKFVITMESKLQRRHNYLKEIEIEWLHGHFSTLINPSKWSATIELNASMILWVISRRKSIPNNRLSNKQRRWHLGYHFYTYNSLQNVLHCHAIESLTFDGVVPGGIRSNIKTIYMQIKVFICKSGNPLITSNFTR